MIKLAQMAGQIGPVAKLVAEKPQLISRYDGSTPSEDKQDIRKNVQVLLDEPGHVAPGHSTTP